MANNTMGIAAYQQTAQTWNSGNVKKKTEIDKNTEVAAKEGGKASDAVKTSTWKPISTKSPLVPIEKEGYGFTIGDVELSDGAKKYYEQLKAKHHGMEFILVSKDMKSQVQANAAAYGNAKKMVVLIDDEKLERMATDEEYRKKYEAIISLSQSQMESAKNSLVSSGANLKNFGMSVNADGTTSFFATLEKASNDQNKIMEKKLAEKKAAKAKEKKLADKKAAEKRLEKSKEARKEQREELEERIEEGKAERAKEINKPEYVEIKANSIDELVSKVSQYAYANSSSNVMTETELSLGQNIDFKG